MTALTDRICTNLDLHCFGRVRAGLDERLKRSKTYNVTLIFLVVFSILFVGPYEFSTTSQAASPVGKTLKADQQLRGSNGNRRLRNNSPIYAREILQTNGSGIGQFQLSDNTLLALGNNSKLVLNESVLASTSGNFTKIAMTTASGALRVVTGDSKSSAFEFRTPVATLGVRGTAFDLFVWRGRLYIMSIAGEISVCNASGECKTLRRKCDCVVVSVDGSFSKTFQPRNGIFSGSDMARYFPFVANQSDLVPSLRLPVQQCAGGRSTGSEPGDTGPGHGGNGNAAGGDY